MNFSWWTFTLQAVNFLILVWLLQRFLFKPVKVMVARRREEISHALTEASTEKQSAERMKQEIEAQRSQIRAEGERLMNEERARLSAERQKMIDDARSEAEKIRNQALKQLDEERVAAADVLLERTVALAVDLAGRLLREVAAPSIDQPFLGRAINYLERLPARERVKLFSPTSTGALMVTTAHPLSAQEQSQWREQLEKPFDVRLSIEFSADPALIAGTVITFPNAILRFNWRDGLAAALKEIRGKESHGDEHSRCIGERPTV